MDRQAASPTGGFKPHDAFHTDSLRSVPAGKTPTTPKAKKRSIAISVLREFIDAIGVSLHCVASLEQPLSNMFNSVN